MSQITVSRTNFEASMLRALAALAVAASCFEDAYDADDADDAAVNLFPDDEHGLALAIPGNADTLHWMFGAFEGEMMPENLRKIEALRNTIENAIGID